MKKIKYTHEPMKLKVVDDFLPPPEKLAEKSDQVKVTITLSKASVEFFKAHAKKKRFHYQKMIRRVLDYYVAYYK
ncbi:MAG: CopG family transcriptional regulator [candidate division FCPU426 bacterium]